MSSESQGLTILSGDDSVACGPDGCILPARGQQPVAAGPGLEGGSDQVGVADERTLDSTGLAAQRDEG